MDAVRWEGALVHEKVCLDECALGSLICLGVQPLAAVTDRGNQRAADFEVFSVARMIVHRVWKARTKRPRSYDRSVSGSLSSHWLRAVVGMLEVEVHRLLVWVRAPYVRNLVVAALMLVRNARTDAHRIPRKQRTCFVRVSYAH